MRENSWRVLNLKVEIKLWIILMICVLEFLKIVVLIWCNLRFIKIGLYIKKEPNYLVSINNLQLLSKKFLKLLPLLKIKPKLWWEIPKIIFLDPIVIKLPQLLMNLKCRLWKMLWWKKLKKLINFYMIREKDFIVLFVMQKHINIF